VGWTANRSAHGCMPGGQQRTRRGHFRTPADRADRHQYLNSSGFERNDRDARVMSVAYLRLPFLPEIEDVPTKIHRRGRRENGGEGGEGGEEGEGGEGGNRRRSCLKSPRESTSARREVVGAFAAYVDSWARGGIDNAEDIGIARASAVAGRCRFCRNRNHVRRLARVAGNTHVGVREVRWEGIWRLGSVRMETSGWAAGNGTTRPTLKLEQVYYIKWASARGCRRSLEVNVSRYDARHPTPSTHSAMIAHLLAEVIYGRSLEHRRRHDREGSIGTVSSS
jgi:hypothetical protein